MLEQATLQKRLGQMVLGKATLLNQQHDHPLLGELNEKLNQANAILHRGGQQGGAISFSDLMYSAFCLNRCEAILERLGQADTYPADDRAVVSMDTFDCGKDRIFLRWLLARATWLRAMLLGYSSHYASPPISNSISVLVVQRLDRNSKLFRLLRKMKTRS